MNTIINVDKVKGKMAEYGMHACDLAKTLNLSRTTMSFKLNGKREFVDSEIFKLTQIFGTYVLNIQNLTQ